MYFDWTHFTPWSSLAGGVLLGLAAAALILLDGRVLGISGIVAGLLQGVVQRSAGLFGRSGGDRGWRWAFLAGLVASPWVWRLVAEAPAARFTVGWPMLVIAGLLVGWGTRMGSGCTSGHGVCGLASLSPRSLVATLCFMGTGFATVFVVRHLLG